MQIMAKNTKVNTYMYVFLFVFLLLVHSDPVVGMKETNGLCRRRSKTWSGYCGDSKHCDQQCRDWEKAEHGACHQQGVGRACFCYFNC
uniref:defensin-like protein 1 n=1 Tax=Erigeron canadensis TaxID=72917 RepID=UPI001CB8E08C|nr:defensin-like protein 1 [Erigeron canadensis]